MNYFIIVVSQTIDFERFNKSENEICIIGVRK